MRVEVLTHLISNLSRESGRAPGRRVPGTPEWAARLPRPGDWLTQKVASLVVENPGKAPLRFGLVESAGDWHEVWQLRRRVYEQSLPYLIPELDARGADRYDRSSFVFAAWWKGRMVATIRATQHPFETLNYVVEPVLSKWLGAGWNADYIEWGRLLVDSSTGLKRLSPGLITYAGLHLLSHTSYRKYFGYTRPEVRKRLSKFHLKEDSLEFSIPHRGSHTYCLLKGDIRNDAVCALPRWLKLMMHR